MRLQREQRSKGAARASELERELLGYASVSTARLGQLKAEVHESQARAEQLQKDLEAGRFDQRLQELAHKATQLQSAAGSKRAERDRLAAASESITRVKIMRQDLEASTGNEPEQIRKQEKRKKERERLVISPSGTRRRWLLT